MKNFNPSGPHIKHIKKGIVDWLKNSPGSVQFYGTTETQAAPSPPPAPPNPK